MEDSEKKKRYRDDEPRKLKPLWIPLYILSTFVFIIEWIGLISIYNGNIDWQVAAVGHLLIVFSLSMISLFIHKMGKDATFFILLTISTFAMGALGGLGTFIALLILRFFLKMNENILDWFDTLFPEKNTALSERVYLNIISQREDLTEEKNVIPFQDILKLGTPEQKHRVLIEMARKFNPRYAGILNEALNDPNHTVRVLSATVIVKIQNSFVEKTISIKRALEKRPDDPELLYSLAQHYDAYAFSGILDKEQEEDIRKNAIKYYLSYLQEYPENERANLSLGRLLVRCGHLDIAYEHLVEVVEKKGIVTTNSLIWLMEALFQMKRLTELRELIDKYRGILSDTDKASDDVIEVRN